MGAAPEVIQGYVLGALVLTGTGGYWAFRLGRWARRQWLLRRLWYWFTGLAHHGGQVEGRLARGQLAAWRAGGTLAVLLAVLAWLISPQVTTYALGVLAISGLILSAVLSWRWVRSFRHRRLWLRPLHRRVAPLAGVHRSVPPRAWLKVERDRSAAELTMPSEFNGDAKQRAAIADTAAAAIGMEAAEAEWQRAAPRPVLRLTLPVPLPEKVPLAEMRAEIERARHDETVWGPGKSGLVKTSLSADSPHAGLSMGSGAGKSVTARSFLAQQLYRGAIGLILDQKMISHQWARDLPNVMIYRREAEIHEALCWLGGDTTRGLIGEVARRNEVALAGSDLEGNVHALVGARIVVVCEELNAAMKMLRGYWRRLRHEDRSLPVRSPALDALDVANMTGRQVLVNLLYMGQKLSVKAIGGDGDARESVGVLAFGRYKPGNWQMLAGDYPMPPPSLTPGRIQVVTDQVRECQAVFMTALEARELAMAGTVAALPAGMPGARAVPGGTPVPVSGPDRLFVPETKPVVPALPGLVTLAEAAAEGIVSCSLAALRKAPQRDPEFPRRKGFRGIAGEYDAMELALWNAGRR